MKDIKPIPTYYKGVKFRSRLEARWAVFFDHIGLKWVYEAEGYDLGNGQYYLPDFYFPDYKYYAEVKPEPCHDNRWERFNGLIGCELMILVGLPDIKVTTCFRSGYEDDYITPFPHIFHPHYGNFYCGDFSHNATYEPFLTGIKNALRYQFNTREDSI